MKHLSRGHMRARRSTITTAYVVGCWQVIELGLSLHSVYFVLSPFSVAHRIEQTGVSIARIREQVCAY
jgi:hypothetical protein